MNNVKIKKSSGETLEVELISYFKVVNIGKKYLFYTQNEVVENDLIKMYVAEIVDSSEGIVIGEKMSEEEWTNLKSIMKSILTGSIDGNIQYLRIEE